MTVDSSSNVDKIVKGFFFLAPVILIPTGLLHGPYVLFTIGMVIFVLPFAVAILALVVAILILSVQKPFVGALLAVAGVNITMIATHGCPESFFVFPFSCICAVEIPIWIFFISNICQTLHFQRKAVVVEAIVVNRFTEENNNSNNNSNSTSCLDYYWVGEYESLSLQHVKLNADEKRTTIQPFYNGNQPGAEKNDLEEYCKEEEEVCYNMQQRFQKKFLVTVELYQATSLELLVLPGQPNKAMLAETVKNKRRASIYFTIFFSIHAGGFSFPGIVMPLKFMVGRSDNDDDWPNGSCKQWQTYDPYISLVLMVMLLSIYAIWNHNQKGEFEAVAVHPTGEQELTVISSQKKKEDEDHHDNDDETACTRGPVGTGRNEAFSV